MNYLNQIDPCLQRELIEYFQTQKIYQQKLYQLNSQFQKDSVSKKTRNALSIFPSQHEKAKKNKRKAQILISEYKEDEINDEQTSLAAIMMVENNLPIIKKDLESIGYSNISLISAGIQSFIVRALNTKNQLRCAIKCIRIKYKQESNQEIQNLIQQEVDCFQRCSKSSNIVKLIHSQICEEFTYLVFQECHRNLQQLLKNNKNKLSEIEIVKYSMNVAQGLYDAQQQNCSVFDLKPENILIDQFGNAFISKFQLEVQKNCYSKQMVSSSPYEAPEYSQATLKNNADLVEKKQSKKESYSLGMFIYRMLINGKEEKIQKFYQQKNITLEDELDGFKYKLLLQRLVNELTVHDIEERISIQDSLCILKGSEPTQIFSGDINELQDSLKESVEFTQVNEIQFSPVLLKPLDDILNENKDWQDANFVIQNSKLFQQTVQQRFKEYSNEKNDLEQQIKLLNEQMTKQQDEINHMNFLSEVRCNKQDFCTYVQVEEDIKNFEEDQIRDYALEKANLFLEILKLDFKAQRLYDFLDQINQKLQQIAYEKKLEEERLERERLEKLKQEEEKAKKEKEEAEKQLEKEKLKAEKVQQKKKKKEEEEEEQEEEQNDNNKTTQTEFEIQNKSECTSCAKQNKALVQQQLSQFQNANINKNNNNQQTPSSSFLFNQNAQSSFDSSKQTSVLFKDPNAFNKDFKTLTENFNIFGSNPNSYPINNLSLNNNKPNFGLLGQMDGFDAGLNDITKKSTDEQRDFARSNLKSSLQDNTEFFQNTNQSEDYLDF